MLWRTWFKTQLETAKADPAELGIRVVARKMGISAAYLHAIVHGQATPTEELLHRIVTRCELSEDEAARLGLSLLAERSASPALRALLLRLERDLDVR